MVQCGDPRRPACLHGTGLQLFKGFLVVLVILLPLFAAYSGVQIAFAGQPGAAIPFNIGLYVIFYLLIQVAVYRARRYRLSHTQWRGIRFSQDGDARIYMLISALWSVATVATAGIAAPWAWAARERYMMKHTLLGDRRFEFTGKGKELIGEWIIVLVTGGIGYIWYAVYRFRYIVANSRLGDVSARSSLTSGFLYGRVLLIGLTVMLIYFALFGGFVVALMKYTAAMKNSGMAGPGDALGHAVQHYLFYLLAAGAFASLLFTGLMQLLGWAMLYLPLVRRTCATLVIHNALALQDITQASRGADQSGEGLADAFDVGIG